MHKSITILAATVALAALATGAALAVHASDAAADNTLSFTPHAAVDNPLVREPIVFWDISGFTLTGPLHSRLAVYNDGLASISSASNGFFGAHSDADFTFVGLDDVLSLRQQLGAAGAGQAGDSDLFVSDVPLQTVTFFPKPAPKSRANTFNFWLAVEPEQQAVLEILDDFIEDHFPGYVDPLTK